MAKQDQLNPNPLVYPVCGECETAYVLRRAYLFGARQVTEEWIWQRDCKHKKAEPTLIDKRPIKAEIKAKSKSKKA